MKNQDLSNHAIIYIDILVNGLEGLKKMVVDTFHEFDRKECFCLNKKIETMHKHMLEIYRDVMDMETHCSMLRDKEK